MEEAAPFISAISALVAIVFAIVVFFISRRSIRRIERPVISLVGVNVQASLKTLHLFLQFKNIGKNPAMQVKIHMYGCSTQDLSKIKKINSIHIINQKDPGISFPWHVEVSSYRQGLSFAFYINVTYQDVFTSKHYRNELWLIYRIGESDLKDMDVKGYREMKKAMGKITFYKIIRRKRRRTNDILPKTFQKTAKFLERAFGKGRETR